MVLFNAATKELTAKIVYYGPGLCGKTTNLQFIYDSLPQDGRGKMLSLATQTDRTLFFDFLPIELGTIRGMKTRIQLYTVPGQVFYDATRKLVLRGADGVVFVADSQAPMLESNKESFQNLIDNLKEQGSDLHELPHVIQWNKRDTPNALPVETLEQEVNRFKVPTFEASAIRGDGVRDTLTGIARQVLKHLSEKYGGGPAVDTDPGATPSNPAAHLAAPLAPNPKAIALPPPAEEELKAEDVRAQADTKPQLQTTPSASPTAMPAPAPKVLEVPVLMERSMFEGQGPVEIKLKLYLK